MFRVTPVPESSKERKVSFSPDADESYRHQVVDKISNLMKEVSVSCYKRVRNNFDHSTTEIISGYDSASYDQWGQVDTMIKVDEIVYKATC